MSAPKSDYVLTVNAGSSSIKLAVYVVKNQLNHLVNAEITNIGRPSAVFTVSGHNGFTKPVNTPDHHAAIQIIIDWIKEQTAGGTIAVLGHRVVHGGPKYYQPQLINQAMLNNLRQLIPFDPEHLPAEIRLIEELQKLFPKSKHVACFDTEFHHDLPLVAQMLAIPRRYHAKGVRRYGFHGLSYQYLLQSLDPATRKGRLVLAHLGNGVSLAAVKDGKSIDTTMGLTPTSGVPMSTRSGDLDPGLAMYLWRSEGLTTKGFNEMVNTQSGLVGIAETTADMEQLLKIEQTDQRAKEAIDLFCYQVKRAIGGLAASLGGIDTLVFSGGMGEQAPKIRSRICKNLEFLGIEVDSQHNNANKADINKTGAKVAIKVIHTDEAIMIAQKAWSVANKGTA